MFDPSDFSDESFSDELETDVATECGKCGQIEKITVFSKHPKGVVIVKFNTSYASQECVKLMDGRFFGGKKLRCYFWDGATDFTGILDAIRSVCLSSYSLSICLFICLIFYLTSFFITQIAQSSTVMTTKKKRKDRKRHGWTSLETG